MGLLCFVPQTEGQSFASSISGKFSPSSSPCTCPANSNSSFSASVTPSPTTVSASNTSSTDGGSDDDQAVKVNSYSAHVAVLIPAIITAAVAHVAFFFLRDKFPQFYQRRTTKTSSPAEIEAPADLTYFKAWALVLKASDVDIIKFVGLDGYIYLRFQQICLEVMTVLGLIGTVILFPIFKNGGGDQEEGYERYSLANVERASSKLWAPAMFLWFASIGTLLLLEKSMDTIAAFAKAYKLNAFGREYTVLVREIPEDFRFESAIRSHFQGIFRAEKVFAVNMVERVETLRELYCTYREQFKAELVAARKQALSKKDTPPTKTVVSLLGFNKENASLAMKIAQGTFEYEMNETEETECKSPTQMNQRRFQKHMEANGLLSVEMAREKYERRLKEAEEGQGTPTDDKRDSGYGYDTNRTNNAASKKGRMAGPTHKVPDFKGRGKPLAYEYGESDNDEKRKRNFQKKDPSVQSFVTVNARAYQRALRLRTKRKIMMEQCAPHEKSPAAFVTFTDLVTAATAAQTTQIEENGFTTTMAPESRDIYWPNLENVTPETADSRTLSIACMSFWLKVFWTIPVALVAALASIESIQKVFPFLKPVLEYDPALSALIAGLLPVIAISVLNSLLPSIYAAFGTYSGLFSKSDITLYTVQNLHYHLVLHSFIVLTISTSIFDSLTEILSSPLDLFPLLGRSIPTAASFFINFVTLNALGNIAMKLAAFAPLVIGWLKAKIASTEKDKDEAYEPGPVDYRVDWAMDLLIWTICISYAAIQPMVLLMGVIYFAHNYVVVAYRIVYMNKVEYETSGKFLATVYQRICAGLILSQITMIGALLSLEGFFQGVVCFPLIIIVSKYMKYHETRYRESLERAIMPLVSAAVIDSERPREKVIDFLSERNDMRVWRQPCFSVDFDHPLNLEPGEARVAPAYGYLDGETSTKGNYDDGRYEKSKKSMKKLATKYNRSYFFNDERNKSKSDTKASKLVPMLHVKGQGLIRILSPRSPAASALNDLKGGDRNQVMMKEIKFEDFQEHEKPRSYHNPLLKQSGRPYLFDTRREDLKVTLRIAGHREQEPEVEGVDEGSYEELKIKNGALKKILNLANLGIQEKQAKNKTLMSPMTKLTETREWNVNDQAYFFFEDKWYSCRVVSIDVRFQSADEVTIYISALHAESSLSAMDPRLRRTLPQDIENTPVSRSGNPSMRNVHSGASTLILRRNSQDCDNGPRSPVEEKFGGIRLRRQLPERIKDQGRSQKSRKQSPRDLFARSGLEPSRVHLATSPSRGIFREKNGMRT